MKLRRRELRDLIAAWLALGVAFAVFLEPGHLHGVLQGDPTSVGEGIELLVRSLLTVGVGFLLHELAHKVVAIRFGQRAEFRADYGMLGVAVLAGLAGFLFAAPGAVHHRGRLTSRENGLIALAGPVTNLGLAAAFLPLTVFEGYLGSVGSLGVTINLVLAAFNMLPIGPLDGRKVLDWSLVAFVVTFVPSLILGVWVIVG